MKTTAAVLHTPDGRFEIEEVEMSEPGPGEVLVKLVATGMCHTDLSMREAHRPTPYPVVLGHEGSGVIDALGSGVVGLTVGQPVVLSYASCGRCAQCLRGDKTYCTQMWDLNFNCCRPDGSTSISIDGKPVGSHFFGQSSWASHAVVPVSSVVPVSGDAPLELLGPLGCGVQTGAGAVLNVFDPNPGASIAVFGCGGVGLSAVLAAQVAGCSTIIGVDTHAGRRSFAEEMGATHSIDPLAGDVVAEIMDLTGGGADFTFDAVGAPGSPGTFEAGVLSLSGSGTFGFVAAGAPDLTVEISPRQLFGKTVTGILEGNSIPQLFIPELIELHRQGRFAFDRMITTFPLDQINEAEHASHTGEVVKPVLLMP